MPDTLFVLTNAPTKEWFEHLVPWLGLIGVAIGALASYLATSAVEARKWRRQQEDRRNEATRVALGEVLEWMDSLERWIFLAMRLTYAYLDESVNRKELEHQWPELISTDRILTLSAKNRAFLADEFKTQILVLARDSDELLKKLKGHKPGVSNAPQHYQEKEEHLKSEPMRLMAELGKTKRAIVDAYLAAH